MEGIITNAYELAIIMIAFGLFLGFTLHGFKIIEINNFSKIQKEPDGAE